MSPDSRESDLPFSESQDTFTYVGDKCMLERSSRLKLELRDPSVPGLALGYHRNVRTCHQLYISRHQSREHSEQLKNTNQIAIGVF